MMKIIQELMAKFYQLIIMVLGVLVLILLIGFGVQTWRVSHWKTQSENADAKCTAQIQKIDLAQQTALAQAQAKARIAEQKAAQQVSEIESKLHEQNTKASIDQAKLITDVRTGTISLRDRFTCPSTTTSSVPKVTTSTSRDITTEKRGLQREDAEFLVQLAGQADEITRQLGSCQAMLIQERQNEIALN